MEFKVTSNNFHEYVSQSDKPVLIDFWAEWCGPCRMLSPVISEIAEEQEGKLMVGKVNVDEEPGLAAEFQVAGIPTVLVFQNGELLYRKVGLHSKEELLEDLSL